MKKDEEALKCFSKAMKYFEGKGKIHQKLAALWKKGIVLIFIQVHTVIEELRPSNGLLRLRSQYLLGKHGQRHSTNIYDLLTFTLQFLQKDDEAIKCFDLVIKACPSCFDAYLKKGVSLKQQLNNYMINQKKLYQEAIEQFDQASLIYPDFIDIYMEKGNQSYNLSSFFNIILIFKFIKQLKLYEESLACIEQALEIDPENKRAKKRKNFLLFYKYTEKIKYKDKINRMRHLIKIIGMILLMQECVNLYSIMILDLFIQIIYSIQ